MEQTFLSFHWISGPSGDESHEGHEGHEVIQIRTMWMLSNAVDAHTCEEM